MLVLSNLVGICVCVCFSKIGLSSCLVLLCVMILAGWQVRVVQKDQPRLQPALHKNPSKAGEEWKECGEMQGQSCQSQDFCMLCCGPIAAPQLVLPRYLCQ